MLTKRVGVFYIGALGYIATTVTAGALALKKRLTERTGMVTELSQFSGLPLIEPEEMVFGGWDIREGSPLESAYAFFKNNTQVPCPDFLPQIEEDLKSISANYYAGVATNCGKAIEFISGSVQTGSGLRAQVEKLRADLRDFKKRNGLEEAVVVNLASTEPPLELGPCHADLKSFEECIASDRFASVRASTLYAYASILEGCPYVNFTPSNGALIPALIELAKKEGVPVMGNDGKTGETLVKSALIPMFMLRNLEILSWEGFNILGNMDGKVLDEPENKESKIISKDQLLCKSLGYAPHSKVHIHYVPSLDDQKTAWNFIHFKGFLGAKMSLQFIWQGFDSVLAAPLVLDLVRLSEFSKSRNEAGVMTQLSSFFKAPIGVNEHRLSEQFRMLTDYLGSAGTARTVSV